MRESFAEQRHILTSLEATLASAVSERAQRPVNPDDNENTGWVLHERQTMLAEVNRHRRRLGKTPVTVDRVCWAERTSKGHVDYQHKFALGCRDLVFEE